MTALIRTELLRLRTTRAAWGLLVAAVLLVAAGSAAVLAGLGGVGAAPRGSVQLRDDLLHVSAVGLFPVLLLGVVAVSGEFHHRTATSTFLVAPDRRRVLAAKAAAAALIGPAVALGLLALAYAIGAGAGAVGLTVDGRLMGIAARSMVVAALWALLGVAVGAAVRHQTAAVALPLLWLLVVEQLLPAYGLTGLLPWLPGGATGALAGVPAPGALPFWAALLVLAGYILALLLPGARAIVRRDIT
jgi:ABC-2 type transport system permease protein